MTAEPARWHEEPVVLPVRGGRPVPRPVAGCPECERLAVLRKAAVQERDESVVVDCNVLLRMHGTGH